MQLVRNLELIFEGCCQCGRLDLESYGTCHQLRKELDVWKLEKRATLGEISTIALIFLLTLKEAFYRFES